MTATIGILVDCSGSMHQIMEPLRKQLFAKVSELSAKGTIQLAVWGFSGYSGAKPEQSFWEVLGFGQTPDGDRFAQRLVSSNGTLLAPALIQSAAAIRAAASGPAVLILLTDAQPMDMEPARDARLAIEGPDMGFAVVLFDFLNLRRPEMLQKAIELYGPTINFVDGTDVTGAIAAITAITG